MDSRDHLVLYGKDPTSDTIRSVFDPKSIVNVSHRTRSPGGFWDLFLDVGEGNYLAWMNRWQYRVKLYRGQRTIFEGKLDVPEMLSADVFKLRFRGYRSVFEDIVDNNGGYSRNYATTGDAIIKNILDNAFHADHVPLNSDQSNIDAHDQTITEDYDDDVAISWNLWRVLTDAQRGILSHPDSNDDLYDLFVWEDRKVYYSARNPSNVTWKCWLKGPKAGVESAPLRIPWMSHANSIKALWDNAGTTTKTSASETTTASGKWFRKELILPHIEANQATAEQKRDGALALRDDFLQESSGLVITRVFDDGGAEKPLCFVRAGDVLRVEDLLPDTASLDSVTRDALRTFYIIGTECEHDPTRRRLTVTPDTQGAGLAQILERNRVL